MFTRLTMAPAAVSLSLCLALSLGTAAPLPVWNTGVDDQGNLLFGGDVDPHWELFLSTDPTHQQKQAFVIYPGWPIIPAQDGVWIANGPFSKWIAPHPDQDTRDGTGGQTAGFYVFRTRIDLSGFDLSTVTLQMRYAVDNFGYVLLNQVPQDVNIFTSYGGWQHLAITRGFVQGENTLDLVVQALLVGDPTGARVELSGAGCKTNVPPRLILQPVAEETCVGRRVQFEVDTDCRKETTYQWRLGEQPVPGATNRIFEIAPVQAGHAGLYDVVVSNPWGSVTSQPARLAVYDCLPSLFNTGVGADHQTLNAGEVDPHYSLEASADEQFPGPQARVLQEGYPLPPEGPWLAHTWRSKWIAPNPNQNSGLGALGGSPEGNYTYRIQFDATGADLRRLRIKGRWLSDNSGELLLNGLFTGVTSPHFLAWQDFSIRQGIQAGVNTLDLVVYNGPPTPNPTGVRMEVMAVLLPESVFQPPRLSVISRQPLRYRLEGAAGQLYEIQYHSLLEEGGVWQTLYQVRLEGPAHEFTEPDGEVESRFYRAVLIEP